MKERDWKWHCPNGCVVSIERPTLEALGDECPECGHPLPYDEDEEA